jgi:hypothetical protein
VCVSSSACQQIFLSCDFIVHGERGVAGGDDCEEDAAKTVTQS